MKKQITSLLLSAVLLLAALGVPALAAQPDEATQATLEATASQAAEADPEPEAAVPAEEPAEEPAAEAEPTAEVVPTEEAAPAVETPTAPEAEAENSGDDTTITLPTPETAETVETPPATEQPTIDPVDDGTEQQQQEEQQMLYVALGDSICAGVGQSDLSYTATGKTTLDMVTNFHNYPAECYVAQVANSLGLDRDHAVNLGLPGLMTEDLLALIRDGTMPSMNMLSGCYYTYPQIREYVSKADVITIQIGSNDAFVPCIVALGNATNWKSEDLAAVILSGTLRTGDSSSSEALSASLKKMKLTQEETNATWKLLTSDMAKICDETYPKTAENLRQIVEAIRAINPDAQIILVGCTNPVPLLPCWTKFFNRVNKYAKQLAEVYDLTYVAIPFAQTDLDAHPTNAGHRYIARKITRAIQNAQ